VAPSIDNKVIPLKVHKYPQTSLDQKSSATHRPNFGPQVQSAKRDVAVADVFDEKNYVFRETSVGVRHANDAMSRSQVADDGLKQVDDMLGRMRALAELAESEQHSEAERAEMSSQFDKMNEELSEMPAAAMLNGEPLLDDNGWTINYQLNPNAGEEGSTELESGLQSVDSLDANINTAQAALASIDKLDALSEDVANSRSQILGMQNQFENTISHLQSLMGTQLTTQTSVMDADHAMESAMVARSQVLQQAGTAISEQANLLPKKVAHLLG